MGLSKAKQPLVKARQRVASLKSSKSFEYYEETYREILHDIQLCYNKLLSTLNGHSKESSLLSQIRHDRDNDELLVYLKQSRNSDEHTIADIAKYQPGGLFVADKAGNIHYIEETKVDPGTNRVKTAMGAAPTSMIHLPSRVVALPVTVRGVVYAPPTTHLGVRIKEMPIEEWLIKGLDYYDAQFAKIELGA